MTAIVSTHYLNSSTETLHEPIIWGVVAPMIIDHMRECP